MNDTSDCGILHVHAAVHEGAGGGHRSRAFAALLPLLSVRPSAEILQRLVLAGLPLADATTQLDTALSQTIAGSASTMYAASQALNGILGYAGLYNHALAGPPLQPGLPYASLHQACVAAGRMRLHVSAPCWSLWDLSRIASSLVSLVGRHRFYASRPLVTVALLPALSCLPVANLYFDYGRALNTARIAQAAHAHKQVGSRSISSTADCPRTPALPSTRMHGDEVRVKPRT